jgi:hypothetical protein
LRCKSDIVARKLIAETWESFTERQIREAQQAGEFDALEGEGRPLQDLDDPHDEFWWVKRKLRRPVAGPSTSLAPLDLEEALRRYWRKARETF